MNAKYLSVFCLLTLSLGGCAQHMAKSDNTMAPPATAAKKSDGAPPAEATATQDTKTAKADPAPAASGAMKQNGKDPAAQKAKDPTPQETAAASKVLPLPPKEIIATINKITTLPRVRYLSRTAQYDYYVGGRIDAKYDIKKSELMVTNAPAVSKNAINCDYSKDGKMISNKEVKECNHLINELTMYLDR